MNGKPLFRKKKVVPFVHCPSKELKHINRIIDVIHCLLSALKLHFPYDVSGSIITEAGILIGPFPLDKNGWNIFGAASSEDELK